MTQIIGHKKMRQSLFALVRERRFPQTSLWYGQSGSGKKMLAFELIQILLCDEPREAQGDLMPCGSCRGCQIYKAGNHPDFFFIKPLVTAKAEKTPRIGAAGSIKIEQIRELKQKLIYAPLMARQQIVLIDNAELMTATTANSLLKLIEEPRPHQLFILVSGQFHRLLMTIRSRAARFHFPPLESHEVQEILKNQSALSNRDQDQKNTVDENTLNFFLQAFSGSQAHVARAVASGLSLADLETAVGAGSDFLSISAQVKKLVQSGVDMPVFLQALRTWKLKGVLESGATPKDIETLDRISVAEMQFTKHIQGEFILENLFL